MKISTELHFFFSVCAKYDVMKSAGSAQYFDQVTPYEMSTTF